MQKYLIFLLVIIFFTDGFSIKSVISQNEMAMSLIETLGKEDNREKVDKLLSQSLIYRKYDLDSALLCCDIALSIAEKINYPVGIAESYFKKSVAYSYNADVNNAIKLANNALDVAESIPDSMIIAKVHYKLASIKKESSLNLSAIEHYKIALKIYLHHGDMAKAAILYTGLGNYFEKISFYDSAAIYYHKYLDNITPNTNAVNVAIVHGNLGKVYQKLGEFDIAREYLKSAYKVIINSTNYKEIGRLYNKMGSLEVELENYSLAKDQFLKADSVFRKYKYDDGISNSHVNLAVLYAKQGFFDLSISKYDSAMVYYRDNDIPDGMIVVWEGKAHAYLKKEIYDTALIYCDSSLSLAKKTQNLNRQIEIYNQIISIYSELEDWENAANTIVLLNDVEDIIFSLKKTITVNDLRIKYNRDKDQLKIFNLETARLEQEYNNLKLAKQRNIFLYAGIGLIIFAFFLLFFFRYRARKNQVIAEQRIQQLQEEKKLMAARFLVEGQENERKRIASAIHDSLGVLLSTSKMHITAIKDSDPENKALIDKATKFLDEANSEMRKISHNMMPGALSKLGLCEALEDLFETLDETEGIDARMEVLGPKERLPENQEIMIYRVVQEMVNNSLKHSKADRIDLTLVIHPDELDLSYSDNGKGFDVEEVMAKKTMGIQSIRSRVKFLDGIIKIDSSPGKGVVYRISVPVDTKRGLTSI